MFRIEIGEVSLPRSPTAIGALTLRAYQEELKCEDSQTILVEAPTGSGKTLAYLVRAISPKDRRSYRTVVMVYPTNALIWDQVNAVERLLTDHFSLKVLKVDEHTIESGGLLAKEDRCEADVLLLAANGESLRALAEERGSSEGRALIEVLRRSFKYRIILTNPDILYYIFFFKFARQEELLSALIQEATPNLLVVDEAHLYYGYSLANLAYMLAYIGEAFDQTIFGSATPIPIDKLLGKKVKHIRATPTQNGDKVRYRCILTIEGSDRIATKDDLDKIIQKIDEFYGKHKDGGSRVKVLVILNSVLTCYALQRRLEEQERYAGKVTGIHGLIPQAIRPRSQSEFKDIVVGTSAVEVGVDFDAASIIFEATDSATFIQRLGRGARHSPCEAHAYIPDIYLGGLRSTLEKKTESSSNAEIEYGEFVAAVSEALKRPENYLDFPFSPQAAPILHAIFLNWAKERPAGGYGKSSLAHAANELKQIFDRGYFNVPSHLKGVFGYIRGEPDSGKDIIDQPDYCTLRMAEKISFRSTLASLPAIFRPKAHTSEGGGGGEPIFEYISFDDLRRLIFKVKTKDKVKSEGLKIPLKMRLEQKFLEVYGIREELIKICAAVRKQNYLDKPQEYYGYINTYPPDNDLREQIKKLVDRQPAVILKKEHDWRLQGIYICDGGFLVVGGDAYVAWYINET